MKTLLCLAFLLPITVFAQKESDYQSEEVIATIAAGEK
jgi:hypothetical protein